jgi:hypothetical protein
MAGRRRKQIVESTQEVVVNEVVNVEVAEVTKDIGIHNDILFLNIDGVGCLVNYYFYHKELPVNMTTTFLPNVKGIVDENNGIKFSHINA